LKFNGAAFKKLEGLCLGITEFLPTKNDPGRKPRPTFLLGLNHPLYSSHVGVICMKMCTPMLADAPPPKFPGNRPIDDKSRFPTWDIEMRYYSKYLIDLCVPWSDESGLLFERSAIGFCKLMNTWNRKFATFIERQRFRFLSNFMSKGNQSNHNEIAATAWWQRNADWWSEMKKSKTKFSKVNNTNRSNIKSQ
jgi:hypothetical protein